MYLKQGKKVVNNADTRRRARERRSFIDLDKAITIDIRFDLLPLPSRCVRRK